MNYLKQNHPTRDADDVERVYGWINCQMTVTSFLCVVFRSVDVTEYEDIVHSELHSRMKDWCNKWSEALADS